MRDIALDTASGDLAISGGDLALTSGPDAVAQRLRLRLSTFLGEWFLDRRVGLPFLRDVLVKNPNRAVVEDLFRRAIASCPGVASLETFALTIRSDRTATVSFTGRTTAGEPIDLREFGVL